MNDWLHPFDGQNRKSARNTADDADESTEPEGLTIEMLTDQRSASPRKDLDEMIDAVAERLPVDGVRFNEDVVKRNLSELLLLIIGLHDQAHGKELMSDITHISGAHLSPGTVYPILHELEETGVLSMHENIRTKEYAISNHDEVRERLERSMLQHVAFGLFINAFLTR